MEWFDLRPGALGELPVEELYWAPGTERAIHIRDRLRDYLDTHPNLEPESRAWLYRWIAVWTRRARSGGAKVQRRREALTREYREDRVLCRADALLRGYERAVGAKGRGKPRQS